MINKKALKHTLSMITAIIMTSALLTSTAFSFTVGEEPNESSGIVEVKQWYDSDGNPLEDSELIDMSKNARTLIHNDRLRGMICCDPSTMRKIDKYSESHLHYLPLPNKCVYDITKYVVCDYCGYIFSVTLIGEYQHIHS